MYGDSAVTLYQQHYNNALKYSKQYDNTNWICLCPIYGYRDINSVIISIYCDGWVVEHINICVGLTV